VSGQLRPPAEVEIVAKLPECGIEPVELGVDLSPQEHPRGADADHVAAVIVLALVGLPRHRTSHPTSGAGDDPADLQQARRVVPAGQLGPDDRHRRRSASRVEQLGQRLRFGGAVVVQEPQPLGDRTVPG